ncbi:MAG: LysR family transcriptional regulator [Alphaproteobacteria bacterium]|nr:LysR family transcriptional regulator [Alphaproteobacteria bacterium]MBU1827616.1 LysR family transcriptional regulator [Alphaproteobacteria bacterium]MBU2077854.1 LysR family transcriptional regulator [Alphaproteobacteria bacterium]MBU2161568.1 LysR family transcriptional regulator [Alphaproteobacteria bacterium]MBU2242721.1 LysR family transcriptional regulator [Alphaproteobacteria bacterium]
MDLIDGLKAFVATAQTGSFTAAADRLGMSNRLTSKYVAELEQRLGVRVLQRTTRKVGITSAGEELLARAPALLDELDAMLSAVTEDSRGFSGTLRVSAPVTFGETYVQGLMQRFAAPHPDLTIDLRLNDSYVDLAAEGVDLAFRIGTLDQPTLKMRKLGEIQSVVVASPAYLADHPAPKRPEDLAHHSCVIDTNRRRPAHWVFVDGAQEIAVTVRSRFMVNSARAARDLAVAGQGIAFCPRFVLGDDLETGRLVSLLDGFDPPGHPISAIYLEGRTLPLKVRALIDFARTDIRQAGIA